MTSHSGPDRLVVAADPKLADELTGLGGRRMVFVAGLPGTGKSLLVHQLAHLTARAGRHVHLLQWDIARPVFEASPAGQRYPLDNGVTHPMVRKAAGLWVRQAVVDWNDRNPGPRHLLIGETPFVGNRFVELARRLADDAEMLLTSASCRFVIAVPSAEVRRFLEDERARRAENPLHPREREDAPPHVLQDLWRELFDLGKRLGIAPGAATAGAVPPYDPAVYQRVFDKLLAHRNVEVVPLRVVLPTSALSVYDYAMALPDLVPTSAEADTIIREAERRYSVPAVLQNDVAEWWKE